MLEMPQPVTYVTPFLNTISTCSPNFPVPIPDCTTMLPVSFMPMTYEYSSGDVHQRHDGLSGMSVPDIPNSTMLRSITDASAVNYASALPNATYSAILSSGDILPFGTPPSSNDHNTMCNAELFFMPWHNVSDATRYMTSNDLNWDHDLLMYPPYPVFDTSNIAPSIPLH